VADLLGVQLMPKIRGVKPDYWTDEDIVDLSIPARLLFIGLWNYACDNGHLQDKPKQIKMRVLPGDDINVSELLRELAEKKRIKRGGGWITVPNLGAHQKIDVRYFTTCDKDGCEDPPEKVSQRESRRAHGGHTAGTRVRTAVARGDGEVMVKGSDGDMPAAGKPRAKAIQLPTDWHPSEAHRLLASERGVDVAEEADKFRDWCAANGATKKDWEATFRNWIRNARGGNVRQLPARVDDQGRIQLPPLPKGIFE
jgi:translation initiation factor IF-1